MIKLLTHVTEKFQIGKVKDDFLLYFSMSHMFAVNTVNYDPYGKWTSLKLF